jgi:hypothetical protein
MPRIHSHTGQNRRPHYLRNARISWTVSDVELLRALVAGNTPTRVIGLKLGRSERAIRRKAETLRLSLKPANQSPYGRHD